MMVSAADPAKDAVNSVKTLTISSENTTKPHIFNTDVTESVTAETIHSETENVDVCVLVTLKSLGITALLGVDSLNITPVMTEEVRHIHQSFSPNAELPHASLPMTATVKLMPELLHSARSRSASEILHFSFSTRVQTLLAPSGNPDKAPIKKHPAPDPLRPNNARNGRSKSLVNSSPISPDSISPDAIINGKSDGMMISAQNFKDRSTAFLGMSGETMKTAVSRTPITESISLGRVAALTVAERWSFTADLLLLAVKTEIFTYVFLFLCIYFT